MRLPKSEKLAANLLNLPLLGEAVVRLLGGVEIKYGRIRGIPNVRIYLSVDLPGVHISRVQRSQ